MVAIAWEQFKIILMIDFVHDDVNVDDYLYQKGRDVDLIRQLSAVDDNLLLDKHQRILDKKSIYCLEVRI